MRSRFVLTGIMAMILTAAVLVGCSQEGDRQLTNPQATDVATAQMVIMPAPFFTVDSIYHLPSSCEVYITWHTKLSTCKDKVHYGPSENNLPYVAYADGGTYHQSDPFSEAIFQGTWYFQLEATRIEFGNWKTVFSDVWPEDRGLCIGGMGPAE